MLDLYLLYCALEKKWLTKDDLYLIGITLIHITIKLEEIFRVPLKAIVKELGKTIYTE